MASDGTGCVDQGFSGHEMYVAVVRSGCVRERVWQC